MKTSPVRSSTSVPAENPSPNYRTQQRFGIKLCHLCRFTLFLSFSVPTFLSRIISQTIFWNKLKSGCLWFVRHRLKVAMSNLPGVSSPIIISYPAVNNGDACMNKSNRVISFPAVFLSNHPFTRIVPCHSM